MLSILIPCAKAGLRMKTIGSKSLIKLNESENILQRQLDILIAKYPHAEIVIVGGFQFNRVYQFVQKYKELSGFSKIFLYENTNYETHSVASTIVDGLKYCEDNDVLCLYGDLVFDKHFFDQFEFKRSGLVTDVHGRFSKKQIGITVDKVIENFNYISKEKWTQIFFLTQKDKPLFLEMFNQNPIGYKIEVFEVFLQMIDKTPLVNYSNNKYIIDVDSLTTIKHINNQLYL